MSRLPTTVACIILASILLGGCPKPDTTPPVPAGPKTAVTPEPPEVEDMGPAVTIRYYGHACFLTSDSEGKSVAIDPYGEDVGYDVPQISADVLLISHDHFDHSNVDAVSGSPTIYRSPADVEGVSGFAGFMAAHHEPGENENRGDIVMWRWELDGMVLAHLGDLGTSLTEEQVAEQGDVDVLMIPVGGHFTIGPEKAIETINAIQPKIVVPMHYKTDATSPGLPIAPANDFLAAVPSDWVVSESEESTVTIPASELESDAAPIKVCVLNYQ